MQDDDRYRVGKVCRGMMPIADVTTDTDVGCLAVGTFEIAAPSIEAGKEGKEMFSLEPLDLFYVSYRTGQWTPLWEYNADVTERDAEREKKKAIKTFKKRNRAELGDIDQRLRLFMSNQFYKMSSEEIGRFERRLDEGQRVPGRLLSERDSPGTHSVLLLERSRPLLKRIENDRHFNKFRKGNARN